MKTRFYISGEKSKRRIISIFMSVIVLINIIVPVYASAADVADNNSCVTGEGLEIPKAFEICSQRTNKAENEYIVSLNVTNDWGNGFTGEIKIQNLSAEPIPRLLACLILSIYLKLTFRQMWKTFQILIPIQILSRYRLK